MAFDLRLFDSIATITSLDELPELEFIWKQYDAQAGGAARRLPSRENPVATTILSKAAANCLRLVLKKQQASGADARPWTMPTQPSTVTAVRMILHIFAAFISDWIFSLVAANNSSRYREARTSVEKAVQEAGLIPLLASAASALAAAMQDEQQQQQQRPPPPATPLPAISLAGELLNVWNVLVHCITAAPQIPTVLSHEQLSAAVGPITQLALTVLQCWDGTSAPSSLRRGSITSVGTLGVDTSTSPEALWSAGVECAAAVPDAIGDAWRKQVNRELQGSVRRQLPTGPCSVRAVNEAMSVPTAAPLALFHLGVVSEVVHRQWGGEQQHQQQGQMQVSRELFTGLGMPAMAASPQPVVQYTGLDKLHVLIALQAAYQTAFNRSQVSALAAHCAASWGVEELGADSIRDLSSTGFPTGLHGTVVQLVLQLLSLCAPYKGHEDLKVLTTGLKMLQLVLSDAALLQHTQHAFAGIMSSSTASASDSSSTAAASSCSSSAAAASPSLEELAGAILGLLVTVVGPLCAKGQTDHPFAAQLFPPMPWEDLFAAEEGGELLPLFGGLLRDVLLVMSPAGATAALAAAYQTKPIVVAQSLEWVLRGCIRVDTPNGLSHRSCGPGPPDGTCSTELNPATPGPNLARAAVTAVAAAATAAAGAPAAEASGLQAPHSSAAAAGPERPGTAPVGSTSLSECLADDLGCLVLLCHRVVLGSSAAGPYWQQHPTGGTSGSGTAAGGSNDSNTAAGGSSGSSTAAARSGSSEAAAKHQVAVLNSCLKLLKRLAVPADEEGRDDMDESSHDGGSGSGSRGSHRLTPAAKWWACQAAAAAAAFGANLAGSTATAVGGDGNRATSSSSSSLLKLHSAGLSLAARGLLFVSRNMQAGSSCAADPQHGAQEVDLISSILSSCRVLQAALAELNPQGREALPLLQEQGQSLLDRFPVGIQVQATQSSVQQVLTGFADDLEQFCKGMAAQVPASFGCNYPECINLLGESELSVATSKCSRCKLAYFCSKECQAAYWNHHKETCHALRPCETVAG